MKKIRNLLTAGLIGLSVMAAGTTVATTDARAQNAEALVDYPSLKPETALQLAQGAMTICQKAGYQVAIAVVDRFGLELVVLRDQFAGAHTVDTARRKAWTAVSFRTATLELTELVNSSPTMSQLPNITDALVLGGGIPVRAAGILVGGIGISGAPGADLDHDCAAEAIAGVQDFLDF